MIFIPNQIAIKEVCVYTYVCVCVFAKLELYVVLICQKNSS